LPSIARQGKHGVILRNACGDTVKASITFNVADLFK
jgi:hypothetical protein